MQCSLCKQEKKDNEMSNFYKKFCQQCFKKPQVKAAYFDYLEKKKNQSNKQFPKK